MFRLTPNVETYRCQCDEADVWNVCNDHTYAAYYDMIWYDNIIEKD